MRSLNSPLPGPFDEALAEQGFKLFHVTAGCISCHENVDLSGPGLFTFVQPTPPAGGLAGGIRVPSLRR
jgi:cytochrome c peroxidase